MECTEWGPSSLARESRMRDGTGEHKYAAPPGNVCAYVCVCVCVCVWFFLINKSQSPTNICTHL